MFAGFPEAGFRFLRQLKKHNDRDWFRDHKVEYEKQLAEPMKELILAVAAGCRGRGLPLYVKEKSPIMRIYRDIRFSKDKSPFKTHVSAELRRSFSDSSCMLYFHLSPSESFVAAGVWQPERPLLQAWRNAIAEEPVRFEKMSRELARQNLELSKEPSLSSMPRGFQNYSEQSFGPWLKLTSFVVSKRLSQAECARPDLVETIIGFALAVKPLFDFGWHVEETYSRPTRAKLEC